MKLFLDTLRTKKPDVNVEHAKDLFKMLKENYDSPLRYYHNWKHVQSCLYEFEMISSKIPIEYHFSIVMSIYYHDYFCNLYRVDNEELSAKRAMFDLLILGFFEEDVKKIHDIIVLTTHKTFCDNIEGQLLLDIDISIFGKSYPQFDEYERNIRREYRNRPDTSYYYDRIRFLREILKRGFIYQTDIFKENYEDLARKNIISLIKKYISFITKNTNYEHLTNFLEDIC